MPATSDDAGIDVPLRLEYELRTHVDNMARTTQELRAIVEALPGPTLPAASSQPEASAVTQYANPVEETLVRLNHVEQLIADISRIINALPFAANPAPAAVVPPPVPAPPQPARQPPQPAPPPPPPAPADAPVSTTTVRTIALIGGGMLAVILGILLRWNFMRKRPSRKDHAAAIEPPPLRDEALELADVMASMGLADGAAQTLVERIRANPRQALSHWLKLLDVYRQTGKREEFENAAAEMRAAFNAQPGSWDSADGEHASLEDYPHIATQLKKLWPAPECGEYLLSLLADNRDGKRAGFPLSVVEEIVLLLAVLRDEED